MKKEKTHSNSAKEMADLPFQEVNSRLKIVWGLETLLGGQTKFQPGWSNCVGGIQDTNRQTDRNYSLWLENHYELNNTHTHTHTQTSTGPKNLMTISCFTHTFIHTYAAWCYLWGKLEHIQNALHAVSL